VNSELRCVQTYERNNNNYLTATRRLTILVILIYETIQSMAGLLVIN